MNRRVLLTPVTLMLLFALIGTALLFTTIYASEHTDSPWVPTLLALTGITYGLAFGPVIAFAVQASALWIIAVVWHRKDPKSHIPSFGELYRSFFLREPLRMVNPPPDDP